MNSHLCNAVYVTWCQAWRQAWRLAAVHLVGDSLVTVGTANVLFRRIPVGAHVSNLNKYIRLRLIQQEFCATRHTPHAGPDTTWTIFWPQIRLVAPFTAYVWK